MGFVFRKKTKINQIVEISNLEKYYEILVSFIGFNLKKNR